MNTSSSLENEPNRHGSATSTLIVGCGYLGKRVAISALKRFPGQRVYATTRSAEKAKCLAGLGVTPILADWTDRRTLSSLPPCERVLVAVSYDRRSRIPREESQVGGFSNLLDILPRWADVCYISTTGVYHQTDGCWVDENSPARARAEGGMAHLRAESLLHRDRPDGKWTILRLSGIYGPGRVPRSRDVIENRPIDGPHEGYLNLIHVDDAADAVLAAWHFEQKKRLYVVSDDKPIIRRQFYEAISRVTGAPPPIFVTDGKRGEASFLSARSASNKRIWNRRFRRDLMPRLTYADYEAGLRAIDLTNRSTTT